MIRKAAEGNRMPVMMAGSAAVAAAMMLLAMTAPHGLVYSWDTACYFQAAASFSVGDGFMNYSKNGLPELMTQYPPLYPVILSAGRFMGMELADWARYLQAVLLGMNLFLTMLFMFDLFRRWAPAAVIAAGLLCWPQFIRVHASALSEPLFLVFMIAACRALVRYRQEAGMFWVSAGLVSLAMLTRYAGVALAFAGAGVLFWVHAGDGILRFRRTGMWLITALAVPAALFFYNLSATGRPVGFVPGVHIEAVNGIIWAANTFYLYFFPPVFGSWGRGLVVAGVLMAVFMMARGAWAHVPVRHRQAAGVLAIAAGAYFVMAVIAMVISNGAIPLDQRILLPMGLLLVFLAAIFFWHIEPGWKRTAWTVFLVVVLAGMGWRTAGLARDIFRAGHRMDGKMAALLTQLPPEVVVYTDNTQLFYLYTGRAAIEIPSTGRDAGYLFPLEDRRVLLSDNKALAVLFNGKVFSPHAAWQELARQARLEPVFQDGVHVVYMAGSRKIK